MIVKSLLAFFGLSALPSLRNDRVAQAESMEDQAFKAHQLSVRSSIGIARAMARPESPTDMLDRITLGGDALRALANETIDRTRR